MSANGWGMSIAGLVDTIDVLQQLKIEYSSDVTYIVGPTVEYAVNRMPHRPESGRNQNETVSGERYAIM